MWNKLRKNILLRYAAASVTVCLIGYFAVAPALLRSLFPQYAIAQKYPSIEVCTDLAPDTPSQVFLPVSCASLGAAHKIGCIYDAAHYVAPKNASTDQDILCKTLVRGVDATGAKNQALAVFPVSETALHAILALSFVGIVTVISVAVRMIHQKVIQKRDEPQEKDTTS